MDVSKEWLSHSRSYVHAKCKKAFGYQYVDKIKPLPKTLHLESWKRMNSGIFGHAAMEAGFLGEDLLEGVSHVVEEQRKKFGYSDAQENELSTMIDDAVQVARVALDWLPVSEWEPYLDSKQSPMVEARLELELPGWAGFLGYADLVARHKPSGGVYVLDYKFREQFEADGADQYNSQFLLYTKALQQAQVPVIGSVLFEIKPHPPKRAPRFLRKDTGTILQGVRLSEDGRMRLTPTHRSRQEVDAYWEDFKLQAQQIAEFDVNKAYRSMSGFNCKSCSFEKLCMAELRGDNVEAVIQQHYSVPRSAIKIVGI